MGWTHLNKTRWLHSLVAIPSSPVGYWTAIHSWELTNEGDP
jgi:hypothetical protein